LRQTTQRRAAKKMHLQTRFFSPNCLDLPHVPIWPLVTHRRPALPPPTAVRWDFSSSCRT
jgi:hypothetical protein